MKTGPYSFYFTSASGLGHLCTRNYNVLLVFPIQTVRKFLFRRLQPYETIVTPSPNDGSHYTPNHHLVQLWSNEKLWVAKIASQIIIHFTHYYRGRCTSDQSTHGPHIVKYITHSLCVHLNTAKTGRSKNNQIPKSYTRDYAYQTRLTIHSLSRSHQTAILENKNLTEFFRRLRHQTWLWSLITIFSFSFALAERKPWHDSFKWNWSAQIHCLVNHFFTPALTSRAEHRPFFYFVDFVLVFLDLKLVLAVQDIYKKKYVFFGFACVRFSITVISIRLFKSRNVFRIEKCHNVHKKVEERNC